MIGEGRLKGRCPDDGTTYRRAERRPGRTDVVSDNLDRVEAHLDSTVDRTKETVHELRNEAEAVAEQALTRVQSVLADAAEARQSHGSAPLARPRKPVDPRICCKSSWQIETVTPRMT